MFTRRIIVTGLVVATATACTDRLPTEAPATEAEAVRVSESAELHRTGLLTAIPVAGNIAGGTFSGLLNITNLALQNGQLVASGVLTGTATVGGVVTEIVQNFTDIPLDLIRSGPGNSCRILELDLGPLHLDLLGLVVDLSAVNLDITAQRGPGNLLGNLLCAVAGLLDGGGPLSAIGNLLNQINNLLGGLLG